LGAAHATIVSSLRDHCGGRVVKAPPPAPAPLPYNWGGLYLGGHVGYLWGRTRVEEEGVVTEPNAAAKGVIGGVLAGYNWQAGPLVFGVEGDFG
jgi:outer membrane immunogenic protein